jgi:hypothetical protein
VDIFDEDLAVYPVDMVVWFNLLAHLHRTVGLREVQGFPFAYWSWFVTGKNRKWPVPR